MKTICIFHKRDLDGWMSAAIVKKWFVEKSKTFILFDVEKDRNISKGVFGIVRNNEIADSLYMLGWDHGDDIPDLSGYDKVIIVDITFPADIMKELHRKFTAIKGYLGKGRKKQPNDFIWIDHHISAIKDMENEYPLGDSSPISMPFGFRDSKFAACELAWKYFFPEEKMPEIVRLLGRYDCFGHKGTDEEQKVLEFQYGARAYISNYNEAYDFLTGKSLLHRDKSTVDILLEYGRVIYKYLCTEARQTYKKAFPIEFNNDWLINAKIIGHRIPPLRKVYKFLCVNQERFNPINFGLNYHDEGYDGFACFWYKGEKWNWSLYNDNGKVDCSVIAKQYEGGGHRGAAGMIIDTETMLKIIK